MTEPLHDIDQWAREMKFRARLRSVYDELQELSQLKEISIRELLLMEIDQRRTGAEYTIECLKKDRECLE